jgi:hypothetical protein
MGVHVNNHRFLNQQAVLYGCLRSSLTANGCGNHHPHCSPLIRRIACDSFCDSSNIANVCKPKSLILILSFPPTLYILNASSIAKPDAIEQPTADLQGYDVDVAITSELPLR